MRLTLLPAALEMIKFIPVPRIEYSDEGFDVAVENVVLTGTTLLPDVFEMKVCQKLGHVGGDAYSICIDGELYEVQPSHQHHQHQSTNSVC